MKTWYYNNNINIIISIIFNISSEILRNTLALENATEHMLKNVTFETII